MAWQWGADPNNPGNGMFAGLNPDQAGFSGGGMMTETSTGERIPYQLYLEREKQRYKEGAEAKKAAEMKAQGLMPDGTPIRPDYQTLLDPTTGLLKDQYQMHVDSLDPSKWEGYSAYKNQALGTGPSPWATMMLEKQGLEEQGQKGAAAAQAQSGMAAARSALGMRGGLSAGARERIALQGSRNLLSGRQQVSGAGALNRLGIGAQDQQNKTSMLGNLMNSEADIGKFNTNLQGKNSEFNIMRSLEEKRAKDSQDLQVYQEQMKKWAADRQATATENSGGGGGK